MGFNNTQRLVRHAEVKVSTIIFSDKLNSDSCFYLFPMITDIFFVGEKHIFNIHIILFYFY